MDTILSFFSYLVVFHFPTKICTHNPLKTSAIVFKLQQNLQNGHNLWLVTVASWSTLLAVIADLMNHKCRVTVKSRVALISDSQSSRQLVRSSRKLSYESWMFSHKVQKFELMLQYTVVIRETV